MISCLAALLLGLHASLFHVCVTSQKVLPLVKPSKYASMGKISQYVGHINGLTDLKSALTACSYKNEIILISTTSNFVDAAAQTIDMLRRFGIAHVIIVSTSEESCKSVALQIQGACCVWEDFEVPPKNPMSRYAFDDHRMLLQIRFRTAARILRLGYNMMFLDTDLIIFDDPYKWVNGDGLMGGDPYKGYFKQPPFSDMNLLAPASGGPLEVNVGIMYVQNAAPDGPVAWMFAEVHDRLLRWVENYEFIHSKKDPVLRNYEHMFWEQSNFGDTVFSAVIGRPVFQAAWIYQGASGREEEFNATWIRTHSQLAHGRLRFWKGDTDSDLRAVSRVNQTFIRFVSLHRPFTQGQWPPHLGGPGFPPSRGKYSQAWQNKLTELGSPMWPDPDDPVCHKEPDAPKPQATARRMMFEELQSEAWDQLTEGRDEKKLRRLRAVAKNGRAPSAWARPLKPSLTSPKGRQASSLSACPGRGKVEQLGFLPTWIASTWSYMDKSRHQWDLDMWPPTQVFGHCLYLVSEKRIYKNAMKMTYGWYNWTLANQSRAGQIYFASTPEVPIPKVLEASGELLKKMEKMDIIQFLMSLRALHTAAAVLGRALAWPYLDCSALARIFQGVIQHPELKRYHIWKSGSHFQIKLIPFTVIEENNKCMWNDYLSGECLDGGIGLLPPEHVHLKSTLPEAQWKESNSNTLSIPLKSTLRHTYEGANADAEMDSILRNVTALELLSDLRSLGDPPIVFLDFLPHFGVPADLQTVDEARLITPLEECWALTLK